MSKVSRNGRRQIVIAIAILYALAVLNGAIAATGDINTFAGGSEEISVFKIDNLSVPAGVVRDGLGNVFVNDSNRIKKIDTSGTISVFAGTVSSGFINGSGVAAKFNTISSLVIDASGNILVADTGNHAIRKVTTAGVVSTVAGTGTSGYTDGPAASARFNRPSAIALDSAGNVFVADSFNKRIRKIDTSGVVSTVAGNGCTQSYLVTCALGDGGPALDATLFVPNGVAVDSSGNVVISDSGHHRIRVVDGTGTITTTVGDGWSTNTMGVDGGYGRFAGDGGPATSASLNLPAGISFDASGNLLVADTFNHRIRQVDTSGTITTVVGDGFGANSSGGRGRFAGDGGSATLASINSPNYAVRSGGSLYVADTMNHRLRKVDSAGDISTIAGTLTNSGCCVDDGLSAQQAKIGPRDLVTSAGDVFIADTEAHRIVKVSSSGVVSTIAGTGIAGYTGDGGAATAATLNLPMGLAIDSAGNLYIGEFGNNRVRRISSSGTISTVAGNGAYGWYGDDGLSGASVAFNGIFDVALDSSGNLYIVDAGNSRIRMIGAGSDGIVTGASDEIVSTVAGDGQYAFLPSSGSCYAPSVCSPLNLSWLSGFLADGGEAPFVIGDGGPATQASLYRPLGIGLDSANNIYIADSGNNRIRKVTRTDGKITTVAGNGLTTQFEVPGLGDGMSATLAYLSAPTGVSVDSAGNIYIADAGHHRIRKVTLGVISTVAGSGTAGFQGDGAAATSARIRDPWTVAIKGSDLLISDKGNFRVRVVTGII